MCDRFSNSYGTYISLSFTFGDYEHSFFCTSSSFVFFAVAIYFQMNPANEIVNFVFYLSYFMTLSTEIFLPCFFGTELLLKNAQLTTAIYSSNWIGRPIYYQKVMAIFMEYTKSPRYLIAGKLFNLSLSNFLLVGNNDLINGCVLRYTRCKIEFKIISGSEPNVQHVCRFDECL